MKFWKIALLIVVILVGVRFLGSCTNSFFGAFGPFGAFGGLF